MSKKNFDNEMGGVFGDNKGQAEQEKNVRMVSVEANLARDLKVIAIAQGKTVKRLLTEVLRDYIKNSAQKEIQDQIKYYQELMKRY